MYLLAVALAMKAGHGAYEEVRRWAFRRNRRSDDRNSEVPTVVVIQVSLIGPWGGTKEVGIVSHEGPTKRQRYSKLLEVISDVSYRMGARKLGKMDRCRPYRPAVCRQCAVSDVSDYGPIEYLGLA